MATAEINFESEPKNTINTPLAFVLLSIVWFNNSARSRPNWLFRSPARPLYQCLVGLSADNEVMQQR